MDVITRLLGNFARARETMFAIILIGLVLIFCVVWFSWKYFSRHSNIPCPSWLHWAVELENPLATGSQSRVIISGLDVKSGMTVLDIGCGPGRLSIPLAKAAGGQGVVIAVDIQTEMLDIVRRKAASEEINNITVVNVPMGEGKLENYAADRAVLVAVLGEIPNRANAMKEIYDSLKCGGILAISETIFDPHYLNKRNILNLAQAIGLSEVGYVGNKLAYTIYLQKHK